MKGQAWNVVETLKTNDHGPLELTRRARAYVWDDIVEIPVAVPLRISPAETRRRRDDDAVSIQQQPVVGMEEEMDISAANASGAPTSQYDLLGLGSRSTDFPNPNRFVLPRPNGSSNRRSNVDGGASRSLSSSLSSPATGNGNGIGSAQTAHTADSPSLSSRLENSEPSLPASAKWRSATSRSSSKGGMRVSSQSYQERSNHIRHHARRRLSSGIRPAIDSLLGDEDLEGDLGYAAAEGMEKNQRRVIVERLENVKSKNPVFTWC